MTAGLRDMSSPVTHGELRDELAQLERRFDDKLGLWGGALQAPIAATETRVFELARQIQATETRVLSELARQIQATETRVLGELARHTQAVLEAMTSQISAIDERYRDLPARTARLEAARHARGPRRSRQ
jgi:predicted AAA+ superfamily ATPase